MNARRVLLINPSKNDRFPVTRLHMGLTLIGEMLVRRGHIVRIVDYAFLRSLACASVPSVKEVVTAFSPDVVGVSVFTYLYSACQNVVGELAATGDFPIILGGPHFSVFPDDFVSDERISYVVRGEAENSIVSLVEDAKRQRHPVIVDCLPPRATEIPNANLDIAVGSEKLTEYQIQLSRGCPYHCSFCSVSKVAGRVVRARSIELCVEEIVEAVARYPAINRVAITDDCPTFDRKRFKEFLALFGKRVCGRRLHIDNVRANMVDEEMLALYSAVGGRNICLGVESGDPEVFGMVNKGERLEDIEEAACMVKAHKLTLGLCFVIGLPGDTYRSHANSVALARRIKPDYVFWNMCVPWPGTPVYDWFKKHGTMHDPRDFSTLVDPRVRFNWPVAETEDFPARERVRAWLGANMETHRWFNTPSDWPKLFGLAFKYRVWRSFAVYSGGTFLPAISEVLWRSVGRIKSAVRRLMRRAV